MTLNKLYWFNHKTA